jgi:hypothetical protein
LQHANQVRKYVLLWVVSFAIVELYNWRQDSSLCSSYASVYQAPMANQQSAAISYQRCQILHSLLQTRLSPYCWWVICGFIYMWCMRRLLWYIWCLWWLFWYIWWLWWILKYIWCLWWILWNAYYACDFGDFYTWKKRNYIGHFVVSNTRRMAKWPKPPAGIGPLPCVFAWAHGKDQFFAVRFCVGARQRPILCRVFYSRRMTNPSRRRLQRERRESLFLLCAARDVRQRFFAVCVENVHDNVSLPCKNLPCALCRVPR